MPEAFVTGGTGFIGSHFLLNFTGNIISHAYVLVRGSDAAERRAKLRAALQIAAESYRVRPDIESIERRITVVDGDIGAHDLGMSASDLHMLESAGLSAFWHFAASLNFEDYRADHIHAANVDGANHALATASHLRIANFVYVSTAYSCGAAEGHIPEQLHDTDRDFLNYYEKSKCLAEIAVTAESASRGITLTILRPSVVIGNSQTKLPGGTTTGLYGIIRELSRLKPILDKSGGSARMFGRPQGEVNFIPIDVLIQDLGQIIKQGCIENGGVFHLTYHQNPRLSQVSQIIFDELGIENLTVADEPRDSMSPIEEIIQRRTSFYGNYMNSQKYFDRKLSQRHEMNVDDFRSFVVEGVNALKRQRNKERMTPLKVRASDGAWLNSYAVGPDDAPVVLICNAVGMPVECLRPLMENLSRSFRAITWECRGLPSGTIDSEALAVDLDRHVDDALDVCDRYGVGQAVVAGWCSGARLALRMAAAIPEFVAGTVLLNGGHIGGSVPTPFEKNIAKVMPLIASNRRYAGVFYESIFSRERHRDGTEEERAASELTSSTLLATDSPQLLHLASLPFQSEENLYLYARILTAYLSEPLTEAELGVNAPTLIVTGTEDTTTNPLSSLELFRRMRNAQFLEVAGADHFGLYANSAVMHGIQVFVESLELEDRVQRKIA